MSPEEETTAELKDRIRDQKEKIRGKDRANVDVDEEGKAKPLADYDPAKPKPTPSPSPSPSPTPDPDMPKDPGPDAGLAAKMTYKKAMEAYRAKRSPQQEATKNLLKAKP